MNALGTGNHAEVVGVPLRPQEARYYLAAGGTCLPGGRAPARLRSRATVEGGAWFVAWDLLGPSGAPVFTAYRFVPRCRAAASDAALVEACA